MGQHGNRASREEQLVGAFLKCESWFAFALQDYLERKPEGRAPILLALTTLRRYYGEDRPWPWIPSPTIREGVVCEHCKGYGDDPDVWGEPCRRCDGTGMGADGLALLENGNLDQVAIQELQDKVLDLQGKIRGWRNALDESQIRAMDNCEPGGTVSKVADDIMEQMDEALQVTGEQQSA